jgi:hypothetical protein
MILRFSEPHNQKLEAVGWKALTRKPESALARSAPWK